MIISDEQVNLIANDIAFDVHYYIMEHLEEYQLYLEQESKSNQDLTNSSIMKGECIYEDEFTQDS